MQRLQSKWNNKDGDRQDVSRAASLGYARLVELGGVVSVDRIGVGAGALSELLGRLSQSTIKGSSAVGCNFGGASTNPGHYENARAEQYWKLREAFQNGEVAIAPLEKEDDIIAGFSQILYEETPQGKLRIESKKFIRQRLHRSPDAEDAIVMAFNTAAIAPAAQPIIVGKRRSVMNAMAGY